MEQEPWDETWLREAEDATITATMDFADELLKRSAVAAGGAFSAVLPPGAANVRMRPCRNSAAPALAPSVLPKYQVSLHTYEGRLGHAELLLNWDPTVCARLDVQVCL
jgi:hypothetical protein